MKFNNKYLDGLKEPHKAKIFKTFASEIKVVDDVKRTLVVKISTPTPDRSSDTVQPSGMQYDNFLKNPVVLFAHKYDTKPIAKCTSLKVSADAVIATVEFLPEGVYAEADIIYTMYKEGFLNAWSIGFLPTDYDVNDEGGYDFKSWELFEFSSVPVPDNPEALTIMRSKGIDVDLVLEKAKDDEAEPYTDETKLTDLTVGDLKDIIEDTLENGDDDDAKAVNVAVTKDVSQVVALGYLLDEITYFIQAFTQMGVKEESITMLKQAQVLIMSVVKDQAIIGEKSMQLPATMKSGRTISAKHEEKLKDARDHMNTAAKGVQDVLDSVAAQEPDDKDEDDSKTVVTDSFVTKLATSLKATDKSVGLTLRLLKTIEGERRGVK